MKRSALILAATVVAAACLPACISGPRDWGGWNVLTQRPPAPKRTLGPVTLHDDADYFRVLDWGESWFRGLTFGNERTMTDVAGFLNAPIQVPCGSSGPPGCYRKERVLGRVLGAIDALDGVPGNLFTGNGGPSGPGYTSDLVLSFPQGTRVHGIPVPASLHTGLDVEAGSPLPLGVVAVPARADEQGLPFLFDLTTLGVGPAPAEKVRLGLTCAACHYSLDVDWDGKADLRSARLGWVTPGSPYRPEDSWAIGNQDIHLGWLFALSANPMLGLTVQSGPVGPDGDERARGWVRWVKENFRRHPDAVLRAVALGMIAQPRGFADDTPDAIFNPTQFPSIFTHQNWPYNVDGVLVNASDRNNNVWAGALDFSALVGLANDRAGELLNSTANVPWRRMPTKDIYAEFTAKELANVMLYHAPAVRTAGNPVEQRTALRALRSDVLGTSDGVPGLLDPDSVVVMKGLPGVLPGAVMDHTANAGRHRDADEYGGDASVRGRMVGMLGLRVRTPPAVRAQPAFKAFLARYPEIAGSAIRVDEFVSDAVSLMLDWTKPPVNHSPLVAGSAGLVKKGYEVFKKYGCDDCHRGPFFTDNLVHADVGTNDMRAAATEPLQSLVAPSYEPATGRAATPGLWGWFWGYKGVGYKTLTLRYVWGSAPYLHDGGVAVARAPGSGAPGTDLGALLREPNQVYGLGSILQRRESGQDPTFRADAALSLQALLVESERERLLAENDRRVYFVPGRAEPVSMNDLGVWGVGHEEWIDDRAGGPEVTALIAFLLALDDCPGQHTTPPTPCSPP